MNLNDITSAVKGNRDTDGGGLSGLMDMAKDFDMQDIEKYKNMSKTELLEEVKNSEHSAKVIEFLKGLIASK